MAGRKTNRDYQYTYEKQATWGTAIDTSPVGLALPDLEIKLEANDQTVERARGLRYDVTSDSWQDTAGKIASWKFTQPHIVTPTFLKDLLPGVLQKSSTGWAAVGNVWTMFPEVPANIPTPAATNDGYFYTLTRNSNRASDDEYIKNALITSMKFSVHPSENHGVLVCEAEGIGQGFTRGATVSGTVGQLDLAQRYAWSSIGTFEYNAFNLLPDFHSMEFTISYGGKYLRDLPAGDAVFPFFTVSGSFTVLAGTNTEAIEGYYYSQASGTAYLLKCYFGDGTVSSAGELNLDFYTKLTSCEPNMTDGEHYTFGFKGELGATASNYPFQAKFYL